MINAATISVAIASYNGARHILAQLESIASQTHLPTEVVVADDCSTDGTPDIVERFAAGAPFTLKLLRHGNNLGIIENFYSAFAACSGDIVYYCDQDDVWIKTKIERTLAQFTANTALVLHQSEITDAALAGQNRIEPGNPIYGRLAEPVDTLWVHGYGHQMAFRRDVHMLMRRLQPIVAQAKVGSFSNNFDKYIPFCASLLGDIVILPDALTRFRRHDAATSSAGNAIQSVLPSRGFAERGAALVTEQREAAANRTRLLEAGRGSGAVAAPAAQSVQRALFRQHARATAVESVANGMNIALRLANLPAVLWRALRPSGFSNDRRWRMAVGALTLAIYGRR